MWEVGQKVINNIGHGVQMAGGFLCGMWFLLVIFLLPKREGDGDGTHGSEVVT